MGLANGPFLWSGLQSLKRNVQSSGVQVIVSPTINEPITFSIPTIFGITSTFESSSKNVKNLVFGLKPVTLYSIFLDLINGSKSSLAI